MSVPTPPSQRPPSDRSPAESQSDLGLGRVLAQESRGRFLNKDGSFNVRRRGLPFWSSLSVYHELLMLSWPAFFGLTALAYLLLNALFAALYFACGVGALDGSLKLRPDSRLLEDFFFSVQTFATIGYGHVSPLSLGANLIATVEAFVGLLTVALATGLMFARFSRPSSRVLFSRVGVIAPFGEGQAFMFRTVNGRREQLIEVEAEVTLSRFEDAEKGRVRRFYPLSLERRAVAFFPLAWTVVHPIGEDSPLMGETPESLAASDAEFLVVLRATVDGVYQTVHARSSYKAGEVTWNARFADLYRHDMPDLVMIDVRRLSDVEHLAQE